MMMTLLLALVIFGMFESRRRSRAADLRERTATPEAWARGREHFQRPRREP